MPELGVPLLVQCWLGTAAPPITGSARMCVRMHVLPVIVEITACCDDGVAASRAAHSQRCTRWPLCHLSSAQCWVSWWTHRARWVLQQTHQVRAPQTRCIMFRPLARVHRSTADAAAGTKFQPSEAMIAAAACGFRRRMMEAS